MWKKAKQPFFIDDEPNNNGSFIFDQMYKTAREKSKCEKDPRFSYFNAIMRMKNKLGVQQYPVYEKVFDPESREDPTQWRNTFTDGFPAYKNRNNPIISIVPDSDSMMKNSNKKRSSIKQLSFNPIRQQCKSQFSKPRLDDILAEYKRIGRRQQRQKMQATSRNSSFSSSLHRKNIQKISLLRNNQSFTARSPKKTRTYL